MSSAQEELMIQLEGFQRASRYDDPDADTVFDINPDEAGEIAGASEELVLWLIQKL